MEPDPPEPAGPQSGSAMGEGGDAPLHPADFLEDVGEALGDRYRIAEDDAFLWLTPFGDDHDRRAQQARYALTRLFEALPGLERPAEMAPWPAILLADGEDLLAYEGLFAGEGASIIHGGCWRRWPVGHLAIPVSSWDALDAAFGHELVHAILDPIGLPLWLQEGIATELETRMGNRRPPLHDPYEWRRTLAYWRSHDAAAFWSGEAFRDPASSTHAYLLAQVMGYRWTASPERLLRAQRMEWGDEDAALRSCFGTTHAELMRAVLEPAAARPRGWVERALRWAFVDERP